MEFTKHLTPTEAYRVDEIKREIERLMVEGGKLRAEKSRIYGRARKRHLRDTTI